MDGFKAIVIVGRPSHHGTQRQDLLCGPRAVAYAFNAFSPALAFMRRTKSQTVVVEFGVEVDTLDFYDAAKALKVPVIFSANTLEPSDLGEFGIKVSNVVFAGQGLERKLLREPTAYRPAPVFVTRRPTSA